MTVPASPTQAGETQARASLRCFNDKCGARFPIADVLYNCPTCGGLIEVVYADRPSDSESLKRTFRERRMSNDPLNASGVWRYRELFPFLDDYSRVTTLREGNTPLLDGPETSTAANYAGLDRIAFKHQGFNPTGSFKDNGMTCGVAQARALGMRRVACVSTGNTSASLAAYAAAAGLEALIFLPHGNISFGKLAQALEYGARTFQVEANFDQILALVRVLAERLGIYLLNSMNPFRIEGQKSIVFEMLDQRDWNPPDWIVLPGGNLGNTSAFGKALREAHQAGLISKMPRLAVIQAEGAAPFYELFIASLDGSLDQPDPRATSELWGGSPDPRGTPSSRSTRVLHPVQNPETLATAIRIGDPVSWPKALYEVRSSNGVVEKVSEQEIADAKAQIGRCGIGCEPASAATLAGIRKLTETGLIKKNADVVAVLTGNLLKDPDYIYRYHTGKLESPGGNLIESRYGNQPIVVPNDPDRIAELLR
jgi:threonine synthase